jgi:putative ATP-dependent DNA ligase
MDRREYFDRLDTAAEEPSELFEHFEQHATAGRTYHSLPDTRHGVERGTVVVPDADAVVRGYPSIPRILVLGPGVPDFFDVDTTVAVEEKLNGFNVRIADVGEVLAFTRGGYVCPYTTPRVRTLLDTEAFFADHPEKMLCAELIGPESPYTPHDYEEVESHAIRVFGIRDRESGTPLPVAERRELCDSYDFDQPRLFARGEPSELVGPIRDAVAELDAAGREGVLLKSADGEAMVKYTTGFQHHHELAHAFSLPFEYGRDFVFSRIIRDAFQAAEFDDTDERLRERAHDLGEAILFPMVEAIRDIEAGKTVGERHTVRGTPEHVAALLEHLRDHSLTLEIEADRREDGERVVEFVKVAESTRDRTQHYLEGGIRDE